ncbi:hypothetical protein CJ030_MR1G007359 [Morella rubra]|uniref:Uncharacterized protein n=1 Tax=Morella rubra TaxID=262757 RepID=A0A6A1WRZ0_9ROSI|nr:hypothetical protein CJ030_MR1G007359 [Morella rubra]
MSICFYTSLMTLRHDVVLHQYRTVMKSRVMIVITPKSSTLIVKSQDIVVEARGKRLRCDSSARSVGASDHSGIRVAATPSNEADDDLSSPASVNPRSTP